MPAWLASLLIALTASDTPNVSRLELAVLPDGTAVAKPAQWVSLRTEAPELFQQWQGRMSRIEQFTVVEMFVTHALLEEWRDLGGIYPRLGTNMLVVGQCDTKLSDAARARRAELNAFADGMRGEAIAKRRRDTLEGRKPYDLAFGPSVRGDSVISVLRKEYKWATQTGNYLLSILVFWIDGRCHSLMVNSKDSATGDIPALIALTERLADATRKAAETR